MPIRLTQEDWQAFERLDGSPQANFEALWRALVLSNYGGKGRFLEYKNHPGVEFLLHITDDIPALGPTGYIVGWQCKYYGSIREGKSLTKTQRKDIMESLAKSKEHSPAPGKWILCIPGKLTKKDVDWLHSLSTTATEVLEWTDEDIDWHLNMSGRGNYLREAYFGKLQLSQHDFEEAFALTFAPLKHRWIPEVHVRSSEENEIRRHLLEPVAWLPLVKARDGLSDLRRYFTGKSDEAELFTLRVIDDFQNHLTQLLDSLNSGSSRNIEAITGWIDFVKAEVSKRVLVLRKNRDARNLPLSNILHVFDVVLDEVEKISKESTVPIVAVMADAGWGKTHLAASLLQHCEGRRKGGILLLAKDLGENSDFNALIRQVVLPGGRSFSNAEELLVALHEFGSRQQCRVPLIVDGLNESQNPSAWKDIIARLLVLLERYRNVLLVVTFRTGYCSSWRHSGISYFGDVNPSVRFVYKDFCLPKGIHCLEASLSHDFHDLVKRYFKYYHIVYRGVVPHILHHPLTLRLFCDATNRDRRVAVHPGSLPSDMSSVFNAFCESAAKHIEEHAPMNFRRRACEYRDRIRNIGKLLWENDNRFASVDKLKQQFPVTDSSWENDWSNVLSQEGLILTRHDWKEPNNVVFEAAYDAFGGYLIADYLTTQFSHNFKEFLSDASFQKNVVEGGHPLSEDILSFLTWLYPLKNHAEMLFDIAPESIRERVLKKTLDCDERHLNGKTLEAFREEAKSNIEFAKRCYGKAWSRLFDLDSHLNAKFLDSILTDLPPVTRDERWGLWLFNNRREMFPRLDNILNQVSQVAEAFVESVFILCKWLLGSVVISIRDRASRLLVLLGERYPEKVLALVSDSFWNNDPYIVERLTAIAYGILMFLYATRKTDILMLQGRTYVRIARETLLSPDSRYATPNVIIRDSIVNSEALLKYATGEEPVEISRFLQTNYLAPINPFRQADKTSHDDTAQVCHAIRVDFENYTLTGLFGLHPYDTGSDKYKKMRAQFEQRMFDIGYRYSLFESVDREIQDEQYVRPYHGQPLYTERFGKKYAKIVLHEMEGVFDKSVYSARRKLHDFIDPSFPGISPLLGTGFLETPFPESSDVESWIQDGHIPDCRKGIVRRFPDTGTDDWVLISGIFNDTSEDGKMILFSTLGGVFAKPQTMRHLVRNPREIDVSPLPQKIYSYHLESPWSFHYRFDDDDPDKDISLACPITKNIKTAWETGMNNVGPTYFYEIPAEWYFMENRPLDCEDSPSGMLLSHYMALRLDLRPAPHSWEFRDGTGRLAVRFYQKRGNKDRYSLLYLRKDLLMRYLELEKTEFAIMFQGERRMGIGELNKHDDFFKRMPRDVGEFHELLCFTKSGFRRVSGKRTP